MSTDDTIEGGCRRMGCERDRVRDAHFCHEDLNLFWDHQLERQADGQYIGVARKPEWLRRSLLKDFTGSAA